MDPNANLEEQRRLAKQILSAGRGPKQNLTLDRAHRLAELVEALDEWISGGGFLPADWQKPTDACGSWGENRR